MKFIGIDLHTNRFTCCYRDERLSDRPGDRVTKTFELDDAGLAAFYATLTVWTLPRLVDTVKRLVLS
jgi:hypothetical protein